MGRTRSATGRKLSEVALLIEHTEARVNRKEFGPTLASWEKCPSSSGKPFKKNSVLPTRREDSGGKNHTLRSGEIMSLLMTHAEQPDKQEETVCASP